MEQEYPQPEETTQKNIYEITLRKEEKNKKLI